MATLSLSDLLTADTEEEVLEVLIAFLSMVGFEPTSWQVGSTPRTMLTTIARVIAKGGKMVSDTALGGYLATALDAWLDALLESNYLLERKRAVTTQGVFVFADNGGGPHSVVAGQLLVTGPGDRVFRNAVDGVIPQNGSKALAVEAIAPGSSYNLLTDAALSLTTSLPTVTVTNPALEGSTSWITRAGADTESNESYRARGRARWPGLGYLLTTAQVYEAAAITASAEVTRAKVFPHQPEPGDVRVILGGAAGPVSEQAVADVLEALQERASIVVNVVVESVVPRLIPVQATLYVEAAYKGGIVAAAQASLATLQASYAFGPKVFRAAIIEALMLPAGMVNAVLPAPAADVVCAPNEVVQFVPSFTVVAS